MKRMFLISLVILAMAGVSWGDRGITPSTHFGQYYEFSGTAPSVTTNRIYVDGGTLKYAGSAVGGGLPAGGSVGQTVINTGSGTGDWKDIVYSSQTPTITAGTASAPVVGTAGAKIIYNLTVNAAITTFPAPSGTPATGQEVWLVLTDDNGGSAPYAISGWNGAYRVVGTVLPATTVKNKITVVKLFYSGSAWLVVGVSQE